MAMPLDNKGNNTLYRWRWAGKTLKGRVVRGELIASNKAEAEKTLHNQHIIIRQLARKRFTRGMGRVNSRDIMLFSRQVATLIRAGVPILQALQVVAQTQKKPVMNKLIQDVMHDISAGASVTQALKRHPKYFDPLFCHLVAAGEQSGTLDTMLERIATYQESNESIKRKVKKALVYPTAVIAVGIGVSALLLINVVPQFEALFNGFDAELPAMTRATIMLSEFVQAWWQWAAAAMLITITVCIQAIRRSPSIAFRVHQFALRLPILGSLLNKSAVARYARTLATTFSAGVPLVDALTSAAGATGNRVYEKAVISTRDDVSGGLPLHIAMRMSGQFPPLVIQMVGIGEEAGALDAMLDRVAEYYEDEVSTVVDNLTTLLEPFILVLLGGMVGFLVISMYLPVFELGGAM
ncbi:type II secretion system F family protein [Halomonas halocynthiae]|uniref:type II secretion system F family protein n=1 Tax=Halomonas halocynthiae TaxID=176290 RepID=UPI0006889B90|nr:type II secretion system F family protein [Halomonas halocynthiae]